MINKKDVNPNSVNKRLNSSTADELAQSELVGMWADREEITDSLEFARQLRYTAEHRFTKRLKTKIIETTEN